MRRRNRKPFSVFRIFMNSMVDLVLGGKFTMKRMEGDVFSDGAAGPMRDGCEVNR